MKMALRTQQGFDDDDDEDLKALRLAALQTIKSKAIPSLNPICAPCVSVNSRLTEVQTLPPVPHRPRNEYNRGGLHRGRHMRNGPFQRHRVNPNLIAIVPKEPSPPSGNTSDLPTAKVAKPSLVVNSASPKLILPQHRYCKTEDASDEKLPEVSTKFDRFEHSSSESSSSAEESDEEAGAEVKKTTAPVDKVSPGVGSDIEPDPDVLLVKDEDEDDNLEKLVNEMEEEMATGTTTLKPQSQRSRATSNANANAHAPKPRVANAPPTRRPRAHKDKTKRHPVPRAAADEKQQPQVSPDSCTTQLPPVPPSSSTPSSSSPPAPPPRGYASRQRPPRPCTRSPSPALRTRSPSPPLRNRSRSRSPGCQQRSRRSRSRTRSRSPPMRARVHYSPLPQSRRSRTRSRSRSPLPPSRRARSRSRSRTRTHTRSLTRSRSRSRSPPPPRKYSPAPRWISPRRLSVSPKYRSRERERSASPLARRPPSPLSYHRRRSPSPLRRNLSPPQHVAPLAAVSRRGYSPPRRNPSPPPLTSMARRRPPSRSRSRTRTRSPLSPSPPPPRRRRPRPPPLSPAQITGRKVASPWSPLRPAPSPSAGGSRRRSDSPRRAPSSPRPQTHQRVRRLVQESRPNDVRRSSSPSGGGGGEGGVVGRRVASPRTRSPSPPPLASAAQPPLSQPSPGEKDWSCTSSLSLSLSPSPERAPGEPARRVRSPLRLRTAARAGRPSYADLGRGLPSTAGDVSALVDDASSKLKRNLRKDRNRSRKHQRNQRNATEGDDLASRHSDKTTTSESVTMLSTSTSLSSTTTTDSSFASAWNAAHSILEARRRKFESAIPIETLNKRIRLKKRDEEEDGEEEEVKLTSAPTKKTAPAGDLILATDNLEELLDLELENAMQLWSDDDSNSDNETRFKTVEKSAESADTPKIRIVPLYKLQGLEAPEISVKEKKKNVDDKDHSIRISLREGLRKSSKKEEQMIEKLEKGGCSSSEVVDQDQKKIRSHLTVPNISDEPEELNDDSKDGDLRAELSRRRAERLTMAGSVHETLPARLVQSAFKDAVGKKNFRKLEREKHGVSKRSDTRKGAEAGDGRRVMVLKSAIEPQIPSISITIPKEEKHKQGDSPGGKVPIRMRLGLPGGGSSFSEDCERSSGGRRRGSRKVKLKRNVLLASPAGEKVMCGSSLYLTLGSMRHSLLCSLPTFLSPVCGLLGAWSSIRARLFNSWKFICSVVETRGSIYEEAAWSARSVFKGMTMVNL